MSEINGFMGTIAVTTALVSTSRAFYKVSPQVFIVSAVAGAIIGFFQETLLKGVDEDRFFKVTRCLMLASLGSCMNLYLFLEMKSHAMGDLAFVQNNYCAQGGAVAAYSAVQLMNCFL